MPKTVVLIDLNTPCPKTLFPTARPYSFFSNTQLPTQKSITLSHPVKMLKSQMKHSSLKSSLNDIFEEYVFLYEVVSDN